MKKLMCLLLFAGIAQISAGQENYSHPNPMLPPSAFIPDGEPHVFEYNGEKRVYLYGSRDERIDDYCGYGHDVWSAPVDDLSKWTNHGEVFNVRQALDLGYGTANKDQVLFAPDCVYNPVTKKYYLYMFYGGEYKLTQEQIAAGAIRGFEDDGPKCFVAESESPAGPFLNPVMCDWPGVNARGTFDPAVLVDPQKDGSVRVFAYWGMSQGDRCAEIDPTDMHTIINPSTRRPDRDAHFKTLPAPENNQHSSLFEASSIRKVADGKYVFIYSPEESPSILTYCYGNSPMGPFKFGGRLVDNVDGWRGGNNHGSIANINGHWYIFYHRHLAGGINRQAMMQPIDLKIIGDSVAIQKVPLLSEASFGKGLNPYQMYNAGVCCTHERHCSTLGAPRRPDGMNPLIDIYDREFAGVKFFYFGENDIRESDNIQFTIHVKLMQKCTLALLFAPEGKENERIEVGRCELDQHAPIDHQYHVITFPLDMKKAAKLKGRMALFLNFRSESEEKLCEVTEFGMTRRGEAIPNPLQDVQIKVAGEGLTATAIPSKARPGESVKILLNTKDPKRVKSIRVSDASNQSVKTYRNAVLPYTPISFHFEMPRSAVNVTVR